MLVLLAERADTRNYTGERPQVPQANGLPEQPNQPASTDQQSCGADQPYVSPLGEGAVQVAASKDAGPVRGPDTRRRLERLGTPNGTRGRSLKTRQTRQGATPSQTSITSSRVIIWWRSVRSLSIPREFEQTLVDQLVAVQTRLAISGRTLERPETANSARPD